MNFSRPLIYFLISIASMGVSISAQASPETEQAGLSQLTQALDDASSSLKNMDDEIKANQQKAAEEQKNVLVAVTAKDAASVALASAKMAHTNAPTTDTERTLKDAEYEAMMAERILSSAQKSLDRAEKKLADSKDEQKMLKQQISSTEKSINDQKALAEKEKSAPSADALKKAAEEKARKEQADRLATQKAAEAVAKQEAALQIAAKKEALKKELGVDLNGCIPLAEATNNTTLTAVDMQLQPFALGELRRVNRLLEEAAPNEAPPLSPAPLLTGSKLKPCDPNKWQSLKFSYLGSGQYRLETPILSGEQEFSVKDIVPSLHRVIPDSDNGAVYVFFLDVKYSGRYKLSAYKKALFEQVTP